ncbi:MAG: 3'(2'),5'-bisphosphate nucleotidase [Chloroflexi bacterium]|nr:3'(2'),5'-bisphosphate nucleotidase [Chloroflexota bacterium]
MLREVIKISVEAGEIIIDLYKNSDIDIQLKNDESPLTRADISSNNHIINRIKKLTPEIPILSEESKRFTLQERSRWKEYWLIDPLDGTKEFINRNGEFTVNIALISNNRPTFGVIHIPVSHETYWGHQDYGSYFINSDSEERKISVNKRNRKKIRVTASRSHNNSKLTDFLNNIVDYEILYAGSSLKFCLIARGLADIYPRLSPTSEWDIAAGEAILLNAGGKLLTLSNKEISYNKSIDFINPSFIASNNLLYMKNSNENI